MYFKEYNGLYTITIEQHEEFFRELKKFCQQNSIAQATFTANGPISSVTLALYNAANQNYTEQSFHKGFELITTQGQIYTDNEEMAICAYATVSDKDFRVYGGKMLRAISAKDVIIILTKLE